MMVTVAIVLSVVALAWCWWNGRRHADAVRRLEGLRTAQHGYIQSLREEIAGLQEEIRALRLASVRERQGGRAFTAETRVGDLAALHPMAVDVLAAFHIGGCASCAVSPDLTLAEAAQQTGQPLEPILAALNALADGVAPEDLLSQVVESRPNIALVS